MVDSLGLRCLIAFCVLFAGGVHAATPPGIGSQMAAPTILVFGDSLSAGYGIDLKEGWVALLTKRLAAEGYGYQVVNASVSGETTGGGRTRLPRALELHQPAVVVLELGSNDGLRGLPLEQMRANLDAMIKLSRDRGARVLLVGMQIPPNYGPTYATGFHGAFQALAERHKVALVPFFMDGVALRSELIQDDGLHPNAAGQPLLLDNVWPFLASLLTRNVNVQRKTAAGNEGAAVQ